MQLLTAPVKRALIVFVFVLPLLSGVLGKVAKSNAWFGDYRAVACGAQKVVEGGALYDMNLKCAGLDGTTAVYVYLPVVAEVFAVPLRILGQDGMMWLYGALYVLSLAVLFWLIYRSKEPPLLEGRVDRRGSDETGGVNARDITRSVAAINGTDISPSQVLGKRGRSGHPTFMQKIPFAAFLTGSAVVWGNIAVLCHAAVLGTALLAKRWPWLFVAVVALCGVIKPVFLTYLAVVLFLDFTLWKRLALFAAGAIAGVLPTLLFATEHSALSEAWRATLSNFVYTTTPGESYYGWLGLLGVRGDSLAANLGWLVFAGLMTLSGLAIAEGLRLDSRGRIWLGLSLGVLMIPRLMSQDVFLIGVGLVYVALYSRSLTAVPGPLTFLKDRGLTVLTLICVFCLIGGAAELGDYTTKIATLLLSLYVMAIGVLTFSERRADIMAALLSRKAA